MISFIIIGMNEGDRLRKSITSVLNVVSFDNIKDIEIIYVDSNSSDDSIHIAKSLGVRTYLITGEYNAAVARNIGAKEAKGDILFFLDGDMEILPGFIPSILNNSKMIYPFISGIFDDVIYNKDWQYQHTSRRMRQKEGDADSIEYTTGGLFIIEKELWHLVGGMDTRFKKSQDYDLGLRLAKLGYPLHRKSMILARHHTVSYYRRAWIPSNKKYASLIFRKHLLNPYSYETIVRGQYTALAFILSLVLSFLSSPLFFILYAITLVYKACRISMIDQKNNYLSIFKSIIEDFLFIWYFCTFYPKEIELKYKQV